MRFLEGGFTTSLKKKGCSLVSTGQCLDQTRPHKPKLSVDNGMTLALWSAHTFLAVSETS